MAVCCAWHESDYACRQDGRVCCSRCPSPDGAQYRSDNQVIDSEDYLGTLYRMLD